MLKRHRLKPGEWAGDMMTQRTGMLARLGGGLKPSIGKKKRKGKEQQNEQVLWNRREYMPLAWRLNQQLEHKKGNGLELFLQR